MEAEGYVRSKYAKTSVRDTEDFNLSLNPETNPFKNIIRDLTRTFEDISDEVGISSEEDRTGKLALLRGATRRRERAAWGQRQRRFLVQGYDSGSFEDEELRSRMFADLEGTERKKFSDTMETDAIVRELQLLREQLSFDAENLEK